MVVRIFGSVDPGEKQTFPACGKDSLGVEMSEEGNPRSFRYHKGFQQLWGFGESPDGGAPQNAEFCRIQEVDGSPDPGHPFEPTAVSQEQVPTHEKEALDHSFSKNPKVPFNHEEPTIPASGEIQIRIRTPHHGPAVSGTPHGGETLPPGHLKDHWLLPQGQEPGAR